MKVPRQDDTIVARATPPGRGGIAVIRVSGPGVGEIATSMLGELPEPRRAELRKFVDATGEPIDSGIALLFPAPHSFTGEDVLELQGHGGTMVCDLLIERAIELGARIAEPGEFSR
ncbi:MAG: tRNA uridine-5-carboxymethylaminomethyl(34) synthesis GTPase MnmE, partial [Bacteroidetes bacterium]|nr:tRNA uridine-5-carboxymethylaminomethyl(34) synthesis GTPase MnmE [Bacteroidota bacterium]